MLNNKTILITGGTGSFGKKCVEIISSRYRPKRLIVFSRDELKQFEMAQKFSEKKYPFISYVLVVNQFNIVWLFLSSTSRIKPFQYT